MVGGWTVWSGVGYSLEKGCKGGVGCGIQDSPKIYDVAYEKRF